MSPKLYRLKPTKDGSKGTLSRSHSGPFTPIPQEQIPVASFVWEKMHFSRKVCQAYSDIYIKKIKENQLTWDGGISG